MRRSKQNPQEILISPHATLKEAVELLNISDYQIIFMANEKKQIIGCVTDGDMRRGFLRGETFDSVVDKVARKSFTSVKLGTSPGEILALMKKNGVRQIPILDDQDHLVEVMVLEDFLPGIRSFSFPAVIMAGGRGTRLLPHTQALPKPLLQIGGRPVIERLIMGLQTKGVNEFYVTVNYMAEKIIDFLGDGAKYGCKIHYTHENKPMGTAGSLSLLKGKIQTPFLVMNGDLLATVDLDLLAQFHEEHGALATVCGKYFTLKLSYGVVERSGHDVKVINEKPDISFLVNSGIYMFSPVVLDWIEDDQYLDMPSLITKLIESGKQVKCFQSTEPWMDIGSPVDFENAQKYGEYLK